MNTKQTTVRCLRPPQTPSGKMCASLNILQASIRVMYSYSKANGIEYEEKNPIMNRIL